VRPLHDGQWPKPARRCHLGPGSTPDGGFTIVELLISLLLTGLLLTLVPPLLSTVLSSTSTDEGIAAGAGQARIAIENINLEVGSASEICLPTSLTVTGPVVSSGFAVRVLTYAFGTGGEQWVQWYLDTTTGTLQEQRWQQDWLPTDPPSPWETVATGVTTAGSSPPFSLPTAVQGSPQSLAVELSVSESRGRETVSVPIHFTVAGLDTPYSPANAPVCLTSED